MIPDPDKFDTLKEYAIKRLKETRFSEYFLKTVKYFRRSLLVSIIVRYTAYAIVLIETSAILFAVLLAFLVSIPAILLLFFFAYIYAKRMNRKLIKKLPDRVYHFYIGVKPDESADAGTNSMVMHSSLLYLFVPPRKEENIYEVNCGMLFLVKKWGKKYRIINKKCESEKSDESI